MNEDVNQPIGRLEILSPEERRQILTEWNATGQPVAESTLPRLFGLTNLLII